jgi:hypothetical protein
MTFLHTTIDRAMALAVCRHPFTAKVRVQSKVSQCGICGGQIYTRTAFSPTIIPRMLQAFLFIHVLPSCICTLHHYQWLCYPTLHIWLFLFEGTDTILAIHTHTHSRPPKLTVWMKKNSSVNNKIKTV